MFDTDSPQVYPIREDNVYGGIRAVVQGRLAEARIHVQIDVGFGDAITPGATELKFPTLLPDLPVPSVLAYPTETMVAEKVEAMVHLGLSKSRMKDFTDVTLLARQTAFDGSALAAAIRTTFRRRDTPLPEHEIVGLSDQFVQNLRTQVNWKADVSRAGRVVSSLWRKGCRSFPCHAARSRAKGTLVRSTWSPGGPWS